MCLSIKCLMHSQSDNVFEPRASALRTTNVCVHYEMMFLYLLTNMYFFNLKVPNLKMCYLNLKVKKKLKYS